MDDIFEYKRKMWREPIESMLGMKLSDASWADFIADFEKTLDAAGDALLDKLREKYDTEIW